MPRLKMVKADGKSSKEFNLPDAVFAVPLNGPLIHEAVVAYRAAGRSGTHATRNRSDVSGGGAKPWRQKKTGRSRHGSSRSPIWKGGGTVFGPTPRDYSYAFPRKKRQGALRSALSEKLRDGKVMVVEALKLEAPRTKELLKVIEDLGIQGSALIVDEPIGRDLVLSARNLKQVKTTLSTAINIMDVLKYDTIVFTEAAAGRVSEVLTP